MQLQMHQPAKNYVQPRPIPTEGFAHKAWTKQGGFLRTMRSDLEKNPICRWK